MAVTETASTQRPSPRRRTAAGDRARRRLGMLYALPTAIYVIVFFVIPLLLVARMSVEQLDAPRRRPRDQLPEQLHLDRQEHAVLAGGRFTIEYTIIVTILLIGLGLGLALLVQESGRWTGSCGRASCSRGDRAGDGLVAVLGLLLAARSARSARRSRRLGLIDNPIQFLETSAQRAAVHGRS